MRWQRYTGRQEHIRADGIERWFLSDTPFPKGDLPRLAIDAVSGKVSYFNGRDRYISRVIGQFKDYREARRFAYRWMREEKWKELMALEALAA